MKTITLAISLAAFSLFWASAFVLINPADSTVNIVAYWTPGEKYSCGCKSDKYKVDENGAEDSAEDDGSEEGDGANTKKGK